MASPALFNMKITFSPNVLLLPSRLIRTTSTRFSFFASSACSWVYIAEPELARWWFRVCVSTERCLGLKGEGVMGDVGDMGEVGDVLSASGSSVKDPWDDAGLAVTIRGALGGMVDTMNCSLSATWN